MRGAGARLEREPGQQGGVELGGDRWRQVVRDDDRPSRQPRGRLTADRTRDARRHVPNIRGSSSQHLVVQDGKRRRHLLPGGRYGRVRRRAGGDLGARGIEEHLVRSEHGLCVEDPGLVIAAATPQAASEGIELGNGLRDRRVEVAPCRHRGSAALEPCRGRVGDAGRGGHAPQPGHGDSGSPMPEATSATSSSRARSASSPLVSIRTSWP